ncbi:Unknown protein, partial [Striga hermonthica]
SVMSTIISHLSLLYLSLQKKRERKIAVAPLFLPSTSREFNQQRQSPSSRPEMPPPSSVVKWAERYRRSTIFRRAGVASLTSCRRREHEAGSQALQRPANLESRTPVCSRDPRQAFFSELKSFAIVVLSGCEQQQQRTSFEQSTRAIFTDHHLQPAM